MCGEFQQIMDANITFSSICVYYNRFSGGIEAEIVDKSPTQVF